jgi:hypothetical protein
MANPSKCLFCEARLSFATLRRDEHRLDSGEFTESHRVAEGNAIKSALSSH